MLQLLVSSLKKRKERYTTTLNSLVLSRNLGAALLTAAKLELGWGNSVTIGGPTVLEQASNYLPPHLVFNLLRLEQGPKSGLGGDEKWFLAHRKVGRWRKKWRPALH